MSCRGDPVWDRGMFESCAGWRCGGILGTVGTAVAVLVFRRGLAGPLISGVLYDRLRCCCARFWECEAECEAMTGIEGPLGALPLTPYALTGDEPSREGARGIAGAV